MHKELTFEQGYSLFAKLYMNVSPDKSDTQEQFIEFINSIPEEWEDIYVRCMSPEDQEIYSIIISLNIELYRKEVK